jgi:hypothetical protein
MKSIGLFILLFLSLGLSAQKWEKAAHVNYNWTAVSESVEGDVLFQKQHHAFSIGLQMYVNQYPDFEEGIYRHVGYADDWFNRMGMNVSYRYFPLKETRSINPFLFFQSLISHLNFHKLAGDGIGNNGTGVDLTDPYWVTENVFGVGFDFELWKNLHVFQAAGYGYEWFFGDDNYTMGINSDWAYTLKLGLLCRFD